MSYDISLMGATYPSVPSILLPQNGGGYAQYYAMDGNMDFLGKGAECINSSLYSKEDSLKNTDWHGWTPSTASKTCVASLTATTFAADLAAYEYYIVWECSVDPVYNSGTTNKALSLLSRGYIIQDILKRPSSPANAAAGIYNGNACVSLYSGTYLKYYGTTTNTLAQTWAASYGWYFGATAATFSNSTSDTPTVTVKTPTMVARCSTTYQSTTNAGLVDEAESTWYIKGKLYRVKPNGILRAIYTNVCGLI